MLKRSSNLDVNQIAYAVTQQATGEAPKVDTAPQKNPAAVALGRLGGLKGGKARAKLLSNEQRKIIAQKAAKARWSKPGGMK